MKVVTFGEIMLRLASKNNSRLFQDQLLEASFGGGEANVAVSLANFGVDSYFVTKLPVNSIGENCLKELKKHSVNTRYISRGIGRMGIYFLEKGVSIRASNVIYDRENSAIALATEGDFNWDEILGGTDVFHFTGITPALSESVLKILKNALEVAKARKVKVSCDLNYRNKLWSKERANAVMSDLMQYVDILIANEEDCADVFGLKSLGTKVQSGEINKEGYIDVAEQVAKKFGIDIVAITLRESISASINNWSAMLYTNSKAYFSREYKINIVDRVGAGDSFGAGLIYSLFNDDGRQDYQKAIEFAVAASALKHTIEGDFNLSKVDEVEALLKTGGSGRIVR